LHSIRDILTLANFNAIFILFLGLFPSHLSHHTEPYCLVNYTNKPWSANEKEIILKEVQHSGISRNKMELNVNSRRIEKMVASKKSGATFSDTGGWPMRVDTIGEEMISSTLISARCNYQPLTISKTKEVMENKVILSWSKTWREWIDIINSSSNNQKNLKRYQCFCGMWAKYDKWHTLDMNKWKI